MFLLRWECSLFCEFFSPEEWWHVPHVWVNFKCVCGCSTAFLCFNIRVEHPASSLCSHIMTPEKPKRRLWVDFGLEELWRETGKTREIKLWAPHTLRGPHPSGPTLSGFGPPHLDPIPPQPSGVQPSGLNAQGANPQAALGPFGVHTIWPNAPDSFTSFDLTNSVSSSSNLSLLLFRHLHTTSCHKTQFLIRLKIEEFTLNAKCARQSQFRRSLRMPRPTTNLLLFRPFLSQKG